MKTKYLLYLILGLAAFSVILIILYVQKAALETEYNPIINPSEFSSEIDNRYFSLTSGKKMVYEAKTEEGTERIEVYVTDETRVVMGVETRVVWDRVWLNNSLIEDTKDWYAQDKEGNVWYFGEESVELIDGKIVSYAGSWEAGIDGAQPGIIMKASPKVGDSYRQEYYKGEAEDMADVLALNEDVKVPFGNFSGCLKTRDYTPLEIGADEYKYYCSEVGGVVLEVVVESDDKVELLTLGYNAKPSASAIISGELKTGISEERAKEIALKRVPGKITDFGIEKKFGKPTYIVEIAADSGVETDVIIDIDTGEILGVET